MSHTTLSEFSIHTRPVTTEKTLDELRAILKKLQADLATTRDSLERALNRCLAAEGELSLLKRQPMFQKHAKRPISRNVHEYRSLCEVVDHLKRDKLYLDAVALKGDSLPAEATIATAELARQHVLTVIKVQNRKDHEVTHMEGLYTKERDLAGSIVRLRKEIKKHDKERKAKGLIFY